MSVIGRAQEYAMFAAINGMAQRAAAERLRGAHAEEWQQLLSEEYVKAERDVMARARDSAVRELRGSRIEVKAEEDEYGIWAYLPQSRRQPKSKDHLQWRRLAGCTDRYHAELVAHALEQLLGPAE